MLPILIAGGGIGGLTFALTLQQIGIPFKVLEHAREMKPMGVGITLQPNAVRELFDLNIGPKLLDQTGIPIDTWTLAASDGTEIHTEPRGLDAGYNWPQYAVHRGAFHMVLYQALKSRAGVGAVRLGQRVTGYRHNTDGSVTAFIDTAKGPIEETGSLLIGADGMHSRIRAQMHPTQPPIHWGGSVMWRGTARAKPPRGANTFLALGSSEQRLMLYPISPADRETGLVTLNWIAERQIDPTSDWQNIGWFRPAVLNDFAHHFDSFRFDWLDLPDLMHHSSAAYENPLIDRDPAPHWVEDRVALLGDAAHVMYPTGSNGATQAIVDARTLGAMMLQHGATPRALAAYNDKLCAPVSDLVLRMRSSGPLALLDQYKARNTGREGDVETLLPKHERTRFLAEYRSAAGFDCLALNGAPPTIPSSARRPLQSA